MNNERIDRILEKLYDTPSDNDIKWLVRVAMAADKIFEDLEYDIMMGTSKISATKMDRLAMALEDRKTDVN